MVTFFVDCTPKIISKTIYYYVIMYYIFFRQHTLQKINNTTKSHY